MPSWQIITGEYPPQPGGVADYSRLVARRLAKVGDGVSVITSACAGGESGDDGVLVQRLPDHFGPRGLVELGRLLGSRAGERILVQYVPHAYGMKAMNLPFCLALLRHRRRDITVMFHEVAYPFRAGQPLRRNALAAVTRAMAALVAHAATRIFVAGEAWMPMLARMTLSTTRIRWLPVPGNVPAVDDRPGTASIRARWAPPGAIVMGHFGTYSEPIAGMLESLLTLVLSGAPEIVALLIGRGSSEFRARLIADSPEFATRVRATGGLVAADLSRHLAACDLMIQPYPDGISARRTTAMAALEHGRPIVTTNGPLTEPLWMRASAVRMAPADAPAQISALALELARDPHARARLGCLARRFYDDHFALNHTIAALRGA